MEKGTGHNQPLKISLLGTFQVVRGREAATFKTDAARVLLAYLAAQQKRPIRRDALATLLSPDRPNRDALTYLRNRLTRLRRAIGDQQAEPPYLYIDRKVIELTAGDHVWVDVVEFEQLLTQVQEHRHRTLSGCQLCLGRLQQAVDLYRGEMLAGLNFPSDIWEEWLLAQREHRKRQALEAMTLLIDAYREGQAWVAMLGVAQHQLRDEPWLESAHRAVMEAHWRLGERTAALTQYEACQQVLWDELGVEPEAATVGLADRIRGATTTAQPPAPSPQPPALRHNLPEQRTPFFGRERELTRLQELLTDPLNRLVSLVGVGGTGKTRLSQQVGLRVLDSYPDGVWFVSLAGIGGSSRANVEEQIITAVAAAHDFTFTQGRSLLDQLCAYLREKTLLLILDNFEHLIDGADVILTLLKRAAHIAVLCTTREVLNFADEIIVWLAGLPITKFSELDLRGFQNLSGLPSIKLFAERAKRMVNDFELSETTQTHIAQIAEMVRGNPLGIELAAAWTRTRSLSQIVTGIKESADFLATRRRDIPARHRSMRAVFRSSWQLLPPEEQEIFAQLSLFRGSFSLAAARKITGATLFDLDILQEKSLVQRVGEERYQVHELLRQFASEELDETDELHQRFAAYYLGWLAEQEMGLNGRFPQKATAAIKQDELNIQQAWQWAIAGEQVDLLSASVVVWGDYYHIQGRVSEARSAFQQLVTQVATRFSSLHCQALTQKIRFLNVLGEYDLALETAVVASDLLSAATNQDKARLNLYWGDTLWLRGDFVAAVACLQAGLASIQEDAFPILKGLLHRRLGVVVNNSSQTEAIEHFEQALSLFRQHNYRRGEAFTLDAIGNVYYIRHQWRQANQAYEQALALFRQSGDAYGCGIMYIGLGNVAAGTGQLDVALNMFRQGFDLSQKMGWRLKAADLSINLGNTYRQVGQFAEAISWLEPAQETYQAIGDSYGEANSFLCVGLVQQQQGRFRHAATSFETAKAICEQKGYQGLRGYALDGLGNSFLGVGDYQQALGVFKQAV
ncbi:MAG: tetratricopeptide repeat protein [Chloroflexota bacterium]